MDTDIEQHEPEPPERRFPAFVAAQDATYPMLAPAAAVPLGSEEDAFDEQILAGLVNL